jgi:hypothetical protein
MVRSWMVRLAMTAIVPALAVGCCHNHKQQSCGCPCQCAGPDNVAPAAPAAPVTPAAPATPVSTTKTASAPVPAAIPQLAPVGKSMRME